MGSKAACVLLFSSTGEVGGNWGSTGVATRKLHGLTDASITVTEEVEALPQVGYYGPGPMADEVRQAAEFSLEGVACYEEMPRLLNGLFTALSAPSSSGGNPNSTGFNFYYNAPVTSTQACFTYTLDYGTTAEPYTVAGGVFNGITISGEAGSYWKYTIPGFGKQVSLHSSGLSTAGAADSRTVNAIAMKDTQFRMHAFNPSTEDAYASSSGLLAASLISFEANINMNRHLKFFAGSAGAQGWGDGKMEGTLRTLLEFNTTQAVDAKYILDAMVSSSDAARSQIQKNLSIYASASSSQYMTALYFAGIVASPIKFFDDRDGNLTVDLTWQGKFSTSLSQQGTSGTGNWFAVKVGLPTSITS